MRGRGGGRGRGSRFREDYLRVGPVTEEQDPYPPNPKVVPISVSLQGEEQVLVALNRTLTNYWKYSSCFYVNPEADCAKVQTYRDVQQKSIGSDYQKQKKLILEAAGDTPSFHFPDELMKDSFKMNQGRNAREGGLNILKRRHATEEGGEGAGDKDGENSEQEEENDDFGGDDYVVEHDADVEDAADDDDKGGDDDCF